MKKLLGYTCVCYLADVLSAHLLCLMQIRRKPWSYVFYHGFWRWLMVF